MSMDVGKIVLELHDAGAVRFGSFLLKSGVTSPVYVVLRGIISRPRLLKTVAEAFWSLAGSVPFDVVCGVPYTALPIATCLSISHDVPMVLRRRDKKDYGTRKTVEGEFREGAVCLVLEDIVTSGSSVLETMKDLQEAGLKVEDAAVLIDREQGGKEALAEAGCSLRSLTTLAEVVRILRRHGRIDKEQANHCLAFLQAFQSGGSEHGA